MIKHVVNNYGGTRAAGDFTINVTGVTPSVISFPGAEAPGATVILGVGGYSVSEVNLYGYTQASSALLPEARATPALACPAPVRTARP